MKNLIVAIALLTSFSVFAEPNFEMTKNWILTKINKYQSEYYYRDGDDKEWTNYDSESYFEINNCSFESVVTMKYRVRRDTYEYKNYIYSGFKIKDFSSMSFNKFMSNYILTFSHKVGRERVIIDGSLNSDNRRSELNVFINYKGGESNLYGRLETAFDRLAHLARENPECADPVEAF